MNSKIRDILYSHIFPLTAYYVLIVSALNYYDKSVGAPDKYDLYLYASFILIIINYEIIKRVSNQSTLLVLWLWFVWPVLGISYAGSFNNLKNTWELAYSNTINFYQPLFIHYIFSTAFCLGALLAEKFNNSDKVLFVGLPKDSPKRAWQNILLAFPLVFFASMYFAWGTIPLLSGARIVDDMYEVKIGITQAFVLIIFFSVQYTAQNVINARTPFLKGFWIFVTITFLFISACDGKRVILLMSLIGVYQLVIKIRGSVSKIGLYTLLCIVAITYITVELIRSANSGVFTTDGLLGGIGVEFMEFAWTTTYYDPGQIPGYSWTKSTFASVVNSTVLNLFGLSKQSMIQMDSARAWSDLHNTPFGIRSGIISELYFEFGYFAVALIGVLGAAFTKLCIQMNSTESYPNYLFLLSIYCLSALALMGQSTVTFGGITTSFYIWIAYKIVAVFSSRTLSRQTL